MAEDQYQPTIKQLATKLEHYPQEQMLKESKGGTNLTIGIPKETVLDEKRTCLTPDSVGLLVRLGYNIVIESKAGLNANYTDHQYSENGATVVYSAKEAFECSIIVKVEPPSLEEIEYMQMGATLLSSLPFAGVKKEHIHALMKKRITAAAFEWIEDKGGLKPIVRSMSEIASNCIISIASEFLSNTNNGKGVMFGGVTGVPPIKVMVLGAGTIGENVTRVARQMGAEVQVYDNHHYKLRRLKKDLGEQIYTAIIDPHTIEKEIIDADVVIGALRSEEGMSLCVINEQMVSKMKPGAIIIDASISQGGCVETSRLTTHAAPTYLVHDVIHYCVPNISSRVSNTATKALSYILTPILNQVNKLGGVDEMILEKCWFRNGIYMYKGNVCHRSISKRFEAPYKNIDLFLAARY